MMPMCGIIIKHQDMFVRQEKKWIFNNENQNTTTTTTANNKMIMMLIIKCS